MNRGLQELGPLERFDPAKYTEGWLAAKGLLAVGVARPERFIHPGSQLGVTIDVDGQPRLNQTGLTLGAHDFHKAAGQLWLQFAYSHGLPPGHVGLHNEGGKRTEILASKRAQSELLKVGSGEFAGAVLLVHEAHFDERGGHDNGPASRQTAPTELILGLTVSDVNNLVGPGGIRGRPDTIEHPTVRRQFEGNGLRAADLAA
jgi:hypothetical protein